MIFIQQFSHIFSANSFSIVYNYYFEIIVLLINDVGFHREHYVKLLNLGRKHIPVFCTCLCSFEGTLTSGVRTLIVFLDMDICSQLVNWAFKSLFAFTLAHEIVMLKVQYWDKPMMMYEWGVRSNFSQALGRYSS